MLCLYIKYSQQKVLPVERMEYTVLCINLLCQAKAAGQWAYECRPMTSETFQTVREGKKIQAANRIIQSAYGNLASDSYLNEDTQIFLKSFDTQILLKIILGIYLLLKEPIGCSVWPSSRSIVILNPTPEHLRVFLDCHFHNTFPRGSSESEQLFLEAPKEKHYYDAWSISRTAKRKQNNGITL